MPGTGGLRRLVISHPAGGSTEVYLHGGHITSWTPAHGVEWLFLSRSAVFTASGTIRGGIPVVFPQFANRGPLPKHGFARRLPWEWTNQADAREGCRAELELTDSDATRALWPHRFRAVLAVELDDTDLNVSLEIRNTGDEPFDFTAALHSYFRVDDVSQAAITGLDGRPYLDKPSGMQELTQHEPQLRFAGEVDRVYRGATGTVTLHDGRGGRALEVASDGFADIVVWNPGQQLAAQLPDLAPGEYLHMVCIEAAQAIDQIELEPGAAWRGSQRMRPLPKEPT
jgi:glucose-6-phosphate 1-epimerase